MIYLDLPGVPLPIWDLVGEFLAVLVVVNAPPEAVYLVEFYFKNFYLILADKFGTRLVPTNIF